MPKMSHIEITRLQGGLAIARFVSGVVIAMVCLFWIEPLGEITYYLGFGKHAAKSYSCGCQHQARLSYLRGVCLQGHR